MNPTTLPVDEHVPNYYSLLATEDDMHDDETVMMSNSTQCMAKEMKPQAPSNILASTSSMPTRCTAWAAIIRDNQLNQSPQANLIFDTTRVTAAIQHAISDSGATGHFLVEHAQVVNKKPAQKPIQIMLPNGKRIMSTHTCNLDIPWLPDAMTEAHIVPGLSHSSLISTRKFCDAGCKVIFDIDECRIYYNEQLVLIGDRDPTTGLWRLPINPQAKPATSLNAPQTDALDLQLNPLQQANHIALNVYTIPHKQNQMKYMHQSFFNAPLPTLIKAIQNDQLKDIPLMKVNLIKKYLAKSPATSKGRMKRPRAGIRSTRPKPSATKTNVTETPQPTIHPNALRTGNIIPDDESFDGANNIFCYAALADKQTGTLYTDATGARWKPGILCCLRLRHKLHLCRAHKKSNG